MMNQMLLQNQLPNKNCYSNHHITPQTLHANTKNFLRSCYHHLSDRTICSPGRRERQGKGTSTVQIIVKQIPQEEISFPLELCCGFLHGLEVQDKIIHHSQGHRSFLLLLLLSVPLPGRTVVWRFSPSPSMSQLNASSTERFSQIIDLKVAQDISWRRDRSCILYHWIFCLSLTQKLTNTCEIKEEIEKTSYEIVIIAIIIHKMF